MRKAILKTLKTTCVITTVTGLTVLAAQAKDDQTTTTGTSGSRTTTESTTADHSAKGFIKEAFQANQAEIDLANVGMSKAQNANLKSFSQMLQTDHTQANNELQPIAQKYGVTLQPTRRTEREANKFEKESSGPEFDQKFTTELLKDHKKTIAKFERAASKLQEADIKQYAENMMPKLREHLQKAATIAREVGVDESTITSIMSKTPAVGGTAETPESTTGTGASGKTDQGSGAQQLQPNTPRSQP
jgi:putative membrane protein